LCLHFYAISTIITLNNFQVLCLMQVATSDPTKGPLGPPALSKDPFACQSTAQCIAYFSPLDQFSADNKCHWERCRRRQYDTSTGGKRFLRAGVVASRLANGLQKVIFTLEF
jgi:hypothetical protein